MDNLVKFINSLTPVEKQHFKKRNSPNADFVILFDYINRKKSCVTSEVLSYLAKKQKGKKSINSSYLSVAKKYLKNRLLESLRAQYIHKKKDHELLSGAMNIDVFMEKGLFPLARMEVQSLTGKNFESSFPIEKLLLLRKQGILNYYENYSRTNLEEIEALFKTRLETAKQVLLEIKFTRVLAILSFKYFNRLNDPDLLKSFLDEPFMKDESLSTDFSARFLYYWVHAQIEDFKNNTEKAANHYNQSIKIWLDNPKHIDAHPRFILEACKYLLHRKDIYSDELSDINFKTLLLKINTENLSWYEKEKYNVIFLLFEIRSLRKQSKWNEIISLSSSDIFSKNQIVSTFTYENVIFSYYYALAQFNNGNYNESENILFNLLNPLDDRLASNPIYINVYILLQILALLEQGKEKQLRHLLPKYKQFLKQRKRLTDFESHFISMASQLISPRFKSGPELVYRRFYGRLFESQKAFLREINFEYDFFISWVKKKELA